MGDITRTELAALGLRAEALASIPTADQDAEIDASSATARSYLRARYPGLGTVTDPAYKSAVARIATQRLLSTRGFAPSQNNSDEVVQINHDTAMRWLRDVANGVAHIDVPETVGETFAAVLGDDLGELSDPPRGW